MKMFHDPQSLTARQRSIRRLVERIAARRARAHDPDLERLPDDPLGVLAYLGRHHRVDTPVLVAELADAEELCLALQGELDRARHGYIVAVQRCPDGPRGQALAQALRLGSRQAVENLMLRLVCAIGTGGERRDERHGRWLLSQRRHAERWLAVRATSVRQAAAGLLEHRSMLEADTGEEVALEWWDELAASLEADALPQLVTDLRLVADAIGRAQPADLPTQAKQALRVAVELTADYRAAVETPPPTRRATRHPRPRRG